MCLAIFKPEGKQLKKKYLEAGFSNNSDGAGFCFIEHKQLVTKKGFFKFENFWAEFEKVPSSSPALIHFRLATHGGKGADNCHPFSFLAGRASVVHNGILPYESTETKSDTACFVDGVLNPLLSANDANDKHIKFLIESAIGDNNKLAVLFSDGNHIIYNEQKGKWHKGCWFSNDGFRRSNFEYVKFSYETPQRRNYYNQPRCESYHIEYCETCDNEFDSRQAYHGACPICYAPLGYDAPVGFSETPNNNF